MKKKLALILSLFMLAGAAGCAKTPQTPPDLQGPPQEQPEDPPEGPADPIEPVDPVDPEPESKGIEAISDVGFEAGFYLRGLNAAVDGTAAKSTIRLDTTKSVAWSVGQWYSKYDLNEAKPIITPTKMIVSDTSKKLELDRLTGTLTMELAASLEYDSIASSRIYWPHLLIEQNFESFSRHFLSGFESLDVTLDFSVLGAAKSPLETGPNSETLPAQFLQYFYVRDANPDSAGFNNFLWFGLGYLDTRYKCMPLSHLQDHAGGNAGNYIYCLGAEETLGAGDFELGREYHVRIDILPYISEALEQAHKDGFMLGTEVGDCVISGMNLGWEVVGIWDISSTVGNLSLKGVPKEEI